MGEQNGEGEEKKGRDTRLNKIDSESQNFEVIAGTACTRYIYILSPLKLINQNRVAEVHTIRSIDTHLFIACNSIPCIHK